MHVNEQVEQGKVNMLFGTAGCSFYAFYRPVVAQSTHLNIVQLTSTHSEMYAATGCTHVIAMLHVSFLHMQRKIEEIYLFSPR